MATRVLIAEQYNLIRQGLARVLGSDPRLTMVGEAENGMDAVAKVHALRPDVALVDVALPGLDGISVTRRIRQETPETQVILLSLAAAEEPDILAMATAGARGFLTLDADVSKVLRYIEQVVSGKAGLSGDLTKKLLEGVARGEHLRAATPGGCISLMSRREKDVLRLISAGASNKEIAASLFVSENTVRAHVRSLMHKVGADNRTQLAIFAVRNGIEVREQGRTPAAAVM
jgi:DNA-binding NarL/FixJ family response regulator